MTSLTMQDAISLTRVSSYKQGVQGESLDVQDALNHRVASAKGFKIVKTFREDFSGRKTHRPVLEEAFDFIIQNESIKAVFFRDIDRLTRGGAIGYTTIKERLLALNIELIDTTGIIQPAKNRLDDLGFEYDWSKRSPSQLNEIMRAENANEEVSVMLTRMIGQEIRLAQKGYNVRESNFGFINKKIEGADGTKRVVSEAHPIESAWIKKMFELRAEGILSDKQICDRVNVLGFQSRIKKKRDPMTKSIMGYIGGKKLSPKQLQRFIKNPIYCGVRIEKWTKYQAIKAAFDGFIPVSLFNKANRGEVTLEICGDQVSLEYGKEKKPRRLENPDYPFRFVVKCPKCKNSLVGSASRGKSGKRYAAYHCSHRGHYFRVPVHQFHETIKSYVSSLKMNVGLLPLVLDTILLIWERKEKDKLLDEQAKQERIKELREKQSLLLDKLIACHSDVVQQKLEKEIEGLEKEISLVENQKKKELSKAEIMKFSDNIRAYMEHPDKLLLNTEGTAQTQQTWSLFFDELPTFEELQHGTPQLSLEMELFRSSDGSKDNLVRQLGLNWNSLTEIIGKWSAL